MENERQVPYEEGENFAKENDLLFLETSAKTAKNIVEAFNLSAGKILNNVQRTGEEQIGNNIKINNENEKRNEDNYQKIKKRKKGCC